MKYSTFREAFEATLKLSPAELVSTQIDPFVEQFFEHVDKIHHPEDAMGMTPEESREVLKGYFDRYTEIRLEEVSGGLCPSLGELIVTAHVTQYTTQYFENLVQLGIVKLGMSPTSEILEDTGSNSDEIRYNITNVMPTELKTVNRLTRFSDTPVYNNITITWTETYPGSACIIPDIWKSITVPISTIIDYICTNECENEQS